MTRRNTLPNVAALQAECDKFNAANPIGTAVTVELDFVDEPFATVTRSLAEVLSGHSAVIWLENVRGCYLLERVKPVASAGKGADQ